MEAAVRGEDRADAGAAPSTGVRTRYFNLAVLLLPGAALALALALRIARLAFQPLWWDEGYSVWFATHSLPEMARLTAEDIHPPLYYALLHLWTRLAGHGPVSLRLLSVMFGVLAIPVVYLAARRILGSARAGVIAALLLAINPMHVYYSQEVRMYGLVALLSSGILWSGWELLSDDRGVVRLRFLRELRSGRLLPALAYIFLVTLALYTQYYAVFLPIGLTLFALWRLRRDGRALVRWLALQAAAALLYLPWVIYAAPRLTLYVSQKVVQDADRPLGPLAYLARHLAAFTAGHLEGPLAPWWPLALVLLLPAVAGMFLALRRPAAPRNSAGDPPPHPAAFLGVVLATALLLGWLIGLRYPFFPDRGERLLLLALPPFIMLVAAGVDALLPVYRSDAPRRRWFAHVAIALLLLASALSLSAYYTVPRYPEDDYRPLIARTVEQGLPEDTVFAVFPWQVGYWRSYAAGIEGPSAILSPSAAWGSEVETALNGALARGRVWFPAHLSLGAILETQVERHLGSGAIPLANTWYGAGTRLSAWSAQDTTTLEATIVPSGAQYDAPNGPLSLIGSSRWEQPVPAANAVVPLALQWGADRPPDELTVSVRLVDDLGQIWGQNDYEPLGGMVGAQTAPWPAVDRLGLLIPAGTPPGRYSVQLVVSTKDGRTLPAAVDGEMAQSVALFPLEVTRSNRALGPERLPIATRAPSQLEDGIRFLGYTVDEAPLAPGEARRINLFWQATGEPSAGYTAFVQALNSEGAPLAGSEPPPGAGYPTSEWTPGTLIRTQATIRFPAETPDGRYPLITGLYNPADGTRLKTERGAAQISLGTLTMKGRPHQISAPTPPIPVDVSFGETARLIGYAAPALTATSPFTVTLYWQALGSTDRPYTVFVHLLDEQGRVAGYGDGEPGLGAYPTTGWLKGEYLLDPRTITPAASATGGPLRLAIGLYDPITGERLPTSEGKEQFLIEPGAR